MAAKKITKPKPQLKNLDSLFGLDDAETQGKLIVQEIPIGNLVPFDGHPFHLYEGERLEDMIESIKTYGVITPVITRKRTVSKESDNSEVLETLIGHNRINAAKLAGLTTVPAIVLEDISDDEAMVYVVESNLMQRSFGDMAHSKKAAVIAMQHGKMFSQGKRNDILEQLKILENPEMFKNLKEVKTKKQAAPQNEAEPDTGIRTDEKIAGMYSLARNTVARYLRINQLNAPLKLMLDKGKITFLVAVELSFLDKQEQEMLAECLEGGFSVNTAKAAVLRECSKSGTLDKDTITDILTGQTTAAESKPRKVTISGDVYARYFKPEQSVKEIEGIVEEALAMYFNNSRGLGNEQ